jgi:putative SOS response-associated peptidase YedK
LAGALKGATACGPTDQIDTWLDPTVSDPHQLGELLKAPPEDFLDCYAVSRQINSVKFDEPEYAKEIALDYTALLQNESSNQE